MCLRKPTPDQLHRYAITAIGVDNQFATEEQLDRRGKFAHEFAGAGALHPLNRDNAPFTLAGQPMQEGARRGSVDPSRFREKRMHPAPTLPAPRLRHRLGLLCVASLVIVDF